MECPLAALLIAPLALSVIASPAVSCAAQETRPRLGELANAEKETTDDVILAVDGEPAAAGRIPDGTSKEARALWETVLRAIGAPAPREDAAEGEVERPRSFELNFNIEHRREGEQGRGTNEFDARLAYLDEGPGYVRGVILENKDGGPKQAMMRGPGSDPEFPDEWYRKFAGKGATDGWVDLRGTDFEEERAQLQLWAEIAFNIARLTDPKTLRIVKLVERKLLLEGDELAEEFESGVVRLDHGDRFILPPNDVNGVVGTSEPTLRELAKGVRWLELHTPDFRFFSKGLTTAQRKAAERMTKRLLFAVDETTGLPKLLLLSPRTDGPLMAPGAVLFQTTDWLNRGGDGIRSMLPGQLLAYERPLDGAGLAFLDKASANLFLLPGGQLNHNLTAAAFEPEE